MVWRYNSKTTKMVMFGYLLVAFLCTLFLSSTSISNCVRLKHFTEAMGHDYSDILTAYFVMNGATLLFVVFTAYGTYLNSVGIIMLFLFIHIPMMVCYVALGIFAIVQLHLTNDFQHTLRKDMEVSFGRYEDGDSMNRMQTYMRCCGIMSPMDYKNRTFLPATCCRVPELTNCNPKVGHHWLGGCYPTALMYLLRQYFVVSMSGLTSVPIFLLGMGLTYLHAVALSSCTFCR